MNVSKAAALAAAVALVATQPAHAVTVVASTTLDLTRPQSLPGPGFQGWQGFDAGFSAVVAEGDTFDLTIDFLGAQSLTLNNVLSLWAFSYGGPETDVHAEGQLSLLDANGDAFLTSGTLNDVEGIVHLGQQFSSSAFSGGLPSPVTFYGLRYVGTVIDYLDPGVTTRTYNDPAFYFDSPDNLTPGVPEPASWAMMIGGFAIAGAAMRRGKAVVSFA